MRVRSEFADAVAELGDEHGGGAWHHAVRVEGGDGWSAVQVSLPNRAVGRFVGAVQDRVPEAEFSIPVGETLPVRTPLSDVHDRVARVTRRSAFELVLDVLQSVGTWRGLLLYAAISGLVASYGVIFGIPFLLTAAMLIAPFGAPAMVCVVGLTMGDAWMLRRGAVRFFGALLVLAAAGALLGLAYGLDGSTSMMELLTNLSEWSALLGVAGGMAGAQALVQAERDSMVTATATGFLVAVSLAPPAAVLGLAAAIGRWDHVGLMAFLVLLTAVGILLGGWAALRLSGVGPHEFSGGHGRSRGQWWRVGGVALALVGLVLWQVDRGAGFRKADLTREAERIVRQSAAAAESFHLLRAEAEFTPGDDRGDRREGFVVDVLVTPAAPGSAADLSAAEDDLRATIHDRIVAEMEDVVPYVNLTTVSRR